jgi:hypothetical protein
MKVHETITNLNYASQDGDLVSLLLCVNHLRLKPLSSVSSRCHLQDRVCHDALEQYIRAANAIFGPIAHSCRRKWRAV